MKIHTRPTTIPHFFALLLVAGLFGQSAKATLAVQEPFDFATSVVSGNVTVVSGVNRTWALATGSPNDNALVAGNLTYSGLVSPTVSNNKMVSVANVTANSSSLQEIGTASSASPRYYSFLLNMTTIPTVGGQIIILNSGSGANLITPQSTTAFTIYAKQIDATHYSLGIRAGTAAAAVYEIDTHLINTTNLVVVKYSNNGVSMTDSLWVNPSSATFGGGSDPASPTVSTGTTGALWKYFILNSTANSGAGAYTLDNLRIGTAYADVTPAAAGPVGTAYFSSIASGDWTTTNTWAYSPDGVALISPATNTPTAVDVVTNNASHAVAVTSAVGASSLDVLGTVTASGAGSLNVVGDLKVGAGGTLDLTTTTGNTAGTVTMTGGSITGTGGTLTAANYNQPVGSANAAVSANLIGTGALTISEPNATLTLSGTNSYSGDTTIANGTLQANGSQSLPSGSILKSGTSTANNSTLNLAVSDANYAMNQFNLGGFVTFSGPNSGLATLTFTNGGVVSGTTGKKLNVLDANTSVVINGPVFDLIGSSGVNHRILTITNNGTLTINAAIQDQAPTVNSGGFSFIGEGLTVFGGTNTYSGTNDINNGTLRVNGPAALSPASSFATANSTTTSTTLDLGIAGNYSARGMLLTGILRVTGSGGASSLTLTGACVMAGNGSRALEADSNVTFTMNESFDLFGGTGSSSRNLNAQGAGDFIFNGSLNNGAAPGTYVCGFRKSGSGTATLNGLNSYNGSTTVIEGTVALGAGASIASSSNITIAAEAIFDVSAVPGGFVLGASQVLGNDANNTNVVAPAILKGSVNASSGTLELLFSNNIPCMTVTNGTLTLSSATTFNITQVGSSLPNGSYLLISKSAGGSVAGTVPASVVVGGGGADSAATLQITGGELFLNVGSVVTPTPIPLTVSQAGNVLTFSWTNAAFHLQSQTSSLAVGLFTNWSDYPGGGSTPVLVTNNPADPAVFFRLVTP